MPLWQFCRRCSQFSQSCRRSLIGGSWREERLNVLDHLQAHAFDKRWGANTHELADFTGRSMIWSGVIDDLPEESNAVATNVAVSAR